MFFPMREHPKAGEFCNGSDPERAKRTAGADAGARIFTMVEVESIMVGEESRKAATQSCYQEEQ